MACACPRLRADDCAEYRYGPRPGELVEFRREDIAPCECPCHDDDGEDDDDMTEGDTRP